MPQQWKAFLCKYLVSTLSLWMEERVGICMWFSPGISSHLAVSSSSETPLAAALGQTGQVQSKHCPEMVSNVHYTCICYMVTQSTQNLSDNDVLSVKYSEPLINTYVYSNMYWSFFEIRICTSSVKLFWSNGTSIWDIMHDIFASNCAWNISIICFLWYFLVNFTSFT